MVFVATGNWPKGFDRLVRAVDELVGQGVIANEVTAQTGHGSYKPKNLRTIDFCSPGQFEKFIADSRFVISHAGMGTIIQALRQNKVIVVVPRQKALGEVSNGHQFATARQLEKEGSLLVAYETSELAGKLEHVDDFVPVRQEGGQRIMQTVESFIKNVETGKRKR